MHKLTATAGVRRYGGIRTGSQGIAGVIFWSAPALLIQLAGNSTGTATNIFEISALAVLGMLHSAYLFISHGGSRISVPGLFALGCFCFVFLPELPLEIINPEYSPAMAVALAIAYYSQVFVAHLLWGSPRGVEVPSPHIELKHPRAITVAITTLVLFGFYLVSQRTGSSTDTLNDRGGTTAYLGHIWFTCGVYLAVVRICFSKLSRAPQAVLVSGVLAFYVSLIFVNGGRLVVAAVLAFAAVIWSMRWPHRHFKPFVIALVPLALALMAAYRARYVVQIRGDTETGLESVTAPVHTYAVLLDMIFNQRLTPSGGSSYIAAMVAPMPRFLWPDKPPGLGYELTALLHPEMLEGGVSQAASFYGEVIYNFGLFGLLPSLVLFGVITLSLDRYLLRSVSTRTLNPFFFAAAVALATGWLDLVWNGASTFAGREGFRATVLIVLGVGLGLLYRFEQRARTRRSPSRRPRAASRMRPTTRRDAVVMKDTGARRKGDPSGASLVRSVGAPGPDTA